MIPNWQNPWQRTTDLRSRSHGDSEEFLRWRLRRPASDRFAAADSSADTSARTEKLSRLEAALFVAEAPLSTLKLAQFATLADPAEAHRLVKTLNDAYARSGSAFVVERVATGYRLLTRPAFAFWLSKLHHRQSEWKLTPPQMETLTIIAYRQPVTRADVEAVRGVQCAEMLKQLMDKGLVKIGGEDDSLGRPYLYITTRRFLEVYGLKNLSELPLAEELRRLPESAAEPPDESDEDAEAA